MIGSIMIIKLNWSTTTYYWTHSAFKWPRRVHNARVCLCLCVSSVPRGAKGLEAKVLHGKKKLNLTRPPPFTTAALDYWVAVLGKIKKNLYSYISLLKMLSFHQLHLANVKGLAINVSEAIVFGGREQCQRWRDAGGSQWETNKTSCFVSVLFPSSLKRSVKHCAWDHGKRPHAINSQVKLCSF